MIHVLLSRMGLVISWYTQSIMEVGFIEPCDLVGETMEPTWTMLT